MKNFNPLRPPSVENTNKFLTRVNQNYVPYTKDLVGTIKDTRKAAGGLLGNGILGPVGVGVESILRGVGTVLGAGAGTAYLAADQSMRTRRGITRALKGTQDDTPNIAI